MRYLSLSTATDCDNYLLLIYLLRDIKVHLQSSNSWVPSAFDRALDKKDEISLLLLVKSGAFKISKEINDRLTRLKEKLEKTIPHDNSDNNNNDIDDSETSSNDDELFNEYLIESLKSDINTLIIVFSNDRIELNHIRQTIIAKLNDKKMSLAMRDYLQSLLGKISAPTLKDLCINKLALYTNTAETTELIEAHGLTAKLNNATLIHSLNVPERHKLDSLPKKRSYEAARLFYQPSEEAKIDENAQAESSKKLCCRVL